MLLSVLTPTLRSRAHQFNALQAELRRQIDEAALTAEVELLSLADDGEASTGSKRNTLLRQATGLFVSSVDDDDTVSIDYIERICDTIRTNPDIDCIGIVGTIMFRGQHPHTFLHSLKYDSYSSKGGIYTRPPYHLNPIRRSIASTYEFLDVSYSEDMEWAQRVRADPRMQREAFIETPLYTYHSRRRWWYQWMLDRTEAPRHALGLTFVNRFRMYSAMRRKT